MKKLKHKRIILVNLPGIIYDIRGIRAFTADAAKAAEYENSAKNKFSQVERKAWLLL